MRRHRDLTEQEKNIVFHGPAEKKHIFYHNKGSNQAGELDFTYFNAVYTVENALAKVKDEKGMKRVEKFLKEDVCPDCSGTRLSAAARAPRLRSISLDEACTMTLGQLVEWVRGVPGSLPQEMRPMAERICERQRMQLARAVRNRTTGVLYVLDEPSIGLHPLDVQVLLGVFQALLDNGATVIVIEHDLDVIHNADYVIDMGPGGGEAGGRIVACGTPEEIRQNGASLTGRYL